MLVFVGYRAIIARYVAKWGIAQMCLCETSTNGGIAPLGGSAKLFLKVSRDMGYRSDSIAVSRDMGPLSLEEPLVGISAPTKKNKICPPPHSPQTPSVLSLSSVSVLCLCPMSLSSVSVLCLCPLSLSSVSFLCLCPLCL